MYEPLDRHGTSIFPNKTFYQYDPSFWEKKCKKLEEENDKLKEKLEQYEKLKKDSNIHVIDGKICYRELEDANIDSVDIEPDGSGAFLKFSGKMVYKDVDTDKIIATRDISADMHGG